MTLVPSALATYTCDCLDVGLDAEAVVVTGVNVANALIQIQPVGPSLHRHYAGCALCTQKLGNPGPQPNSWDPLDNSAVVPYFKVLTKPPNSGS